MPESAPRRTIADVLAQQFADARAGVALNRDAAASAASFYIGRRLLQLERHYPNHRFVFRHRVNISGLYVYPGIGARPSRRIESVETVHRALGRHSFRFASLRNLKSAQMDLDEVAQRVCGEFNRMLGRIDSATRELRRSVAADCGVTKMKVYEAQMLIDAARAGDPGAGEKMRGDSDVYYLLQEERAAAKLLEHGPEQHAKVSRGRNC